LLEQALFNLLRNAIESMRETAPDQRQITIALTCAEGYASLTIADRGCGIEASDCRASCSTRCSPPNLKAWAWVGNLPLGSGKSPRSPELRGQPRRRNGVSHSAAHGAPMSDAIAHIVDDDPAVRDALQWLLRSRGVASRAWDSADGFLAAARHDLCGCLLLDVRMPGMSGIELFDRLRAIDCRLPVIFLTGHGDVPMAVQALKDGAFDFVEKPYDDNALVDKVVGAMALDAKRSAREDSVNSVRNRLVQLTLREQEVMQQILAGKLNKVIADELGIAMRTVEVHRSHIFEKMGKCARQSNCPRSLGVLGDNSS
jgi:two-component system response regulator DctR